MSYENYTHRQNVRDAEYRRAYEAWVASLSAEEKAKLAEAGVAHADVPKDAHGQRQNASDLSAASYAPDMASQIDPAPTAIADNAELRADTLASFCARIRSAPNPLLVFDAICFATGVLSLDGLSQTALAKRHRVSRAAFSKIATQWCKTFGLTPSRGMKSEKARMVYSQLTRAKWDERNRRQSR
jgi:hypothetical protein